MRLVFLGMPFGMTLTKDSAGRAEVTKVVSGGQAQGLGVEVGDEVIGIGSLWMNGYDEVMAEIMKKQFPLTIVFRRHAQESFRQYRVCNFIIISSSYDNFHYSTAHQKLRIAAPPYCSKKNARHLAKKQTLGMK